MFDLPHSYQRVMMAANLTCPPRGNLAYPPLPPDFPTPPGTPNALVKAEIDMIRRLSAQICAGYDPEWSDFDVRQLLIESLGAPIFITCDNGFTTNAGWSKELAASKNGKGKIGVKG